VFPYKIGYLSVDVGVRGWGQPIFIWQALVLRWVMGTFVSSVSLICISHYNYV
jgi:hypothetical protein